MGQIPSFQKNDLILQGSLQRISWMSLNVSDCLDEFRKTKGKTKYWKHISRLSGTSIVCLTDDILIIFNNAVHLKYLEINLPKME